MRKDSRPRETEPEANLVVARNDNIDAADGRIGGAERDDGHVDVRRFLDGLVVGQRVGHDEQAGLHELALDLVSERTRGVSAGDVLRVGELRELEHGTLAVPAQVISIQKQGKKAKFQQHTGERRQRRHRRGSRRRR